MDAVLAVWFALSADDNLRGRWADHSGWPSGAAAHDVGCATSTWDRDPADIGAAAEQHDALPNVDLRS